MRKSASGFAALAALTVVFAAAPAAADVYIYRAPGYYGPPHDYYYGAPVYLAAPYGCVWRTARYWVHGRYVVRRVRTCY